MKMYIKDGNLIIKADEINFVNAEYDEKGNVRIAVHVYSEDDNILLDLDKVTDVCTVMWFYSFSFIFFNKIIERFIYDY